MRGKLFDQERRIRFASEPDQFRAAAASMASKLTWDIDKSTPVYVTARRRSLLAPYVHAEGNSPIPADNRGYIVIDLGQREALR